MIYNRLLSKYFPSPGKQRLFFFFKWRKVPATQYPRTPVGLGFYLITWAGFCSHIYRPLSLPLAGTGCQFPRCCLRLSNAQVQSPCWITSGVEQKWQIIHFLLKLTLSSSCFPQMLYTGRFCMFCSVFSAVASVWAVNYSVCGERMVTWGTASSLYDSSPHHCSNVYMNPVGQEAWCRDTLSCSLPCHFPPHWMVNQSRITFKTSIYSNSCRMPSAHSEKSAEVVEATLIPDKSQQKVWVLSISL